MKSFLTLLLLGGMTFAGCNKKSSEPSGGGEEGGGGGTPAYVSKFDDKKLVVDSVTAEPEAAASEFAPYETAVLSCFKEDKAAQLAMTVPTGGNTTMAMILYGTYVEAENSANFTFAGQYIVNYEAKQDFGDDYSFGFLMSYNESTQKYTINIDEGEGEEAVHVVLVCSASAEAPVRDPLICAPYVLHGAVGAETWVKTELHEDPENDQQYLVTLTLAADEEFVIYGGGGYYFKYAAYTGDKTHAGHMVVKGSGDDDSGYNLKALEAGEYTIYYGSYGIGIVHERAEAQVEYTFTFMDSFAAADGAELFAWVWGDAENDGHWVKLTTTEQGGHAVATFSVSNHMYYCKVVRVNPAATAKPVDGSSTYGDGVDDQLWNWSNDFPLSGLGGSLEILLENHH